ncbi:MAG: thioredoxin domain-containing protein [Terracidiphilus sp.]
MEICSRPHNSTGAARHSRAGSTLFSLLFAVVVLAAATSPHALFAQLPSIKVLDNSALHPPAGARVAIVEFDDMECPTCAHYNPLLRQAAEHYKIPLIRHDFIIPFHNWSRRAAIDARWFDTRSKSLGDEFRDAVFADQDNIYNQGVLNQFALKFAQDHGIAMPFAVDPMGKFDAAVSADSDLGKRTGVDATPTIFIVTSGGSYKQVLDPDRELYRDIDQALATTRGR